MNGERPYKRPTPEAIEAAISAYEPIANENTGELSEDTQLFLKMLLRHERLRLQFLSVANAIGCPADFEDPWTGNDWHRKATCHRSCFKRWECYVTCFFGSVGTHAGQWRNQMPSATSQARRREANDNWRPDSRAVSQRLSLSGPQRRKAAATGTQPKPLSIERHRPIVSDAFWRRLGRGPVRWHRSASASRLCAC
jgi:hypothetical protein